MTYLQLVSSSSPMGPRACIFWVEMPIPAPRPNSPPSVNRVLGIWWLGNLLYPELYDYDMVQVAQEYYRLFWHYDLTAEEAERMLSHSTLK